jgi:hypothetical protein
MRCAHCGYKLVGGRCPIPCGGKPLADQATPLPREVEPVVVYWSPTP